VLVKSGRIIGRGWHHRTGEPHAEIEALGNAERRGHGPQGATLYVTLEPCCTHGRTPPCTDAILAAGIKRVVVGATDPNPRHYGRGLGILKQGGVTVVHGVLADECTELNEAFNHWIVKGTPFVTVKAAMTLDGKIATATGESKWITSAKARALGMQLRLGADAILVGINTILADDPSLTFRGSGAKQPHLRRIVLDSEARTPLNAKVVSDKLAPFTTVVTSREAPRNRIAVLARKVNVWVAPTTARRFSGNPGRPAIDLRWLMWKLGAEGVTNLLVEGGGEVNASFLLPGLAHRVVFFYAPKILGGRDARKGVAGEGARTLAEMVPLTDVAWHRLGPDWLLTAKCAQRKSGRKTK
jgi:diaminohydroxyphosphoribosylaminopyrimidine deaminase/5-amino-6-(5-phosphoribosylamino)uracil reductase